MFQPFGPTRTHTYIAFDGDADLMAYRTIQRWSADERVPFMLLDAHHINYARDDSLPESIIQQLKERLDRSRHLMLLVGSTTNRNRRGILQYEINYAIRNQLPILVVFIGFGFFLPKGVTDAEALWGVLRPRLPSVLRDAPQQVFCTASPFTRTSVVTAIQNYDVGSLPSAGYTWCWYE